MVVRFFKVLIDPFGESLRLPPKLSQIMEEGLTISARVLLISRIGRWGVDLRRTENSLFCLYGPGWEAFVLAHNLVQGEFLVFENLGGMHFQVLVFGHDQTEKIFSNVHVVEAVSDNETDDLNPGFDVTLDSWSVDHSCVIVPVPFAQQNGLMRNKAVHLFDDEGRTWNAKLRVSYSGQQIPQVRLQLLKGVFEDLKIDVGDTVTFEVNYVGPDVVNFKVVVA